jgi:hypothetical protein
LWFERYEFNKICINIGILFGNREKKQLNWAGPEPYGDRYQLSRASDGLLQADLGLGPTVV